MNNQGPCSNSNQLLAVLVVNIVLIQSICCSSSNLTQSVGNTTSNSELLASDTDGPLTDLPIDPSPPCFILGEGNLQFNTTNALIIRDRCQRAYSSRVWRHKDTCNTQFFCIFKFALSLLSGNLCCWPERDIYRRPNMW